MIKAKRRQPGTGKPWPKYQPDREYCVVYKRGEDWHRQFFMASSAEEAERKLPIAAAISKHKTIWLASELKRRDEEEAEQKRDAIRKAKEEARNGKPAERKPDPPSGITHEERLARRAEYEALKQAYYDGANLWWISDDLRKQFEDFRPRKYIGAIYGDDIRPTKTKEGGGHVRLKASMRESHDTSPGWDNAVRAMEDAA